MLGSCEASLALFLAPDEGGDDEEDDNSAPGKDE